jgi:hypothetical protein
VYEIVWKDLAEPDRPRMTTWRIRFAFSITKASNTYPEYAILWRNERALILRYTYIAYLVVIGAFLCSEVSKSCAGFSVP